MTYQSINPNDGKLLKSFEHLTPAQPEKSIACAQHCYQTWKHRSYAERAVVLNKAFTSAYLSLTCSALC